MRSSTADENGESDDANLLIRLGVSRVVAVKDGLGVQRQWNCVVNQRPVYVAGLRHVREDHGNWSEDDEDNQVAEGDVLESNATGIKER